ATARHLRMKLYKSNEPNTFHYVTLVTHNRAPVFRSDVACQLFVDVLSETRERYPYKLVGYVLMPDHVHAITNSRSGTISDWLRRIRGNSARKILAWLRDEGHLSSLKKLALLHPQKRQHTHFRLAKGSFGNRFVEPQVHPTKAKLSAFE